MTIWFDVEDLFNYFRHGNKRISGSCAGEPGPF